MQLKLMDEPLVAPTGGGLGAQIRGVDLRRLGALAQPHPIYGFEHIGSEQEISDLDDPAF
jgi:hypothetical protein